MSKSDYMLCTNISYLQYKDRIANDRQFAEQMSKPQQWCLKDIDQDSSYKIINSQKIPSLEPLILNRGNESITPKITCPKQYNSQMFNIVTKSPRT